MFVAQRFHEPRNGRPQLQNVTSWPYFSLWNLQDSIYHEVVHHIIGPTSPDHIASVQPAIRAMFDDRQVEVFRVNITSPIPVETGNILGLSQRMTSMANHYHSIKVLRQIGGYGFAHRLICHNNVSTDLRQCTTSTNTLELQEMPYISIGLESLTSKTYKNLHWHMNNIIYYSCIHVHV